jgi:cell division protein FtsW
MGEGTFVKQPSRKASQRPLNLRFDVPLLLIVITLIIYGLVMVYSASWDFSYIVLGEEPHTMFLNQLRSLAIALVAALVLSVFPYQRYRRLLVPMMLVVIVMLIGVLVINRDTSVVVRTMMGGSVQPSELAKLAIVIYLAFWLTSKKEHLHKFAFGLAPMGAIVGTVAGLIAIQPDLSAMATVVLLGGLMFFLAGGEWRQLILVVLLIAVIGFVVVQVYSTGMERITSYIAGIQDPTQGDDQILRSLEAIVKGGWFGVGIGQATTKYTGLPLAPTDSIFAVVAEELGFAGIFALVALYAGLLWRGMVIARRANHPTGSLLAAGLTIWIVIEAVINMGVIAGLLPVAGNALPFISAGGSSLLCTLAAVGIIMNVARTSVDQRAEEGRSFSAVVDLRGRDRRGREPRARRPSSTR